MTILAIGDEHRNSAEGFFDVHVPGSERSAKNPACQVETASDG